MKPEPKTDKKQAKILKDSLDRGLDTQPDYEEEDTPHEEYEACYKDGSLQNECWKSE